MDALLQRGEVDPTFLPEDQLAVQNALVVEFTEGSDDLPGRPGGAVRSRERLLSPAARDR